MSTLQIAIGWFALGVAAALAIAVIVLIVMGRINLALLLGDKNGDASLSRFQFLVFTFVIAFSFLYLVFARDGGFPEISGGVLTLLGISGSSYLVSKGIDGQTPDADVAGDDSGPGGQSHQSEGDGKAGQAGSGKGAGGNK